MPQVIHLTINGETRAVPADTQRSLLVVLREELGLTGAKYGCAVAPAARARYSPTVRPCGPVARRWPIWPTAR
jgi:hypothetical protein